jgi:hypothetical protein
LRLQLDVLNLVNAQTNRIDYNVSRLPGESLDGVTDRHAHPVERFRNRLTAALNDLLSIGVNGEIVAAAGPRLTKPRGRKLRATKASK